MSSMTEWVGDGVTKRFALRHQPSTDVSLLVVMENGVAWPGMRYGVDSGYRWSYDAETNSLIVADDEPPPAIGHTITVD